MSKFKAGDVVVYRRTDGSFPEMQNKVYTLVDKTTPRGLDERWNVEEDTGSLAWGNTVSERWITLLEVGDIVDYTSEIGPRYDEKGDSVTKIDGGKVWIRKPDETEQEFGFGGWTHPKNLTFVRKPVKFVTPEVGGFRVGDKVTHKSDTRWPGQGEVIALVNGNAVVKWPNGTGSALAVHTTPDGQVGVVHSDWALTKVEPRFKVGDRVKYVGSAFVGRFDKQGTVTKYDAATDGVRVQFDGEPVGDVGCFTSSIRKIDKKEDTKVTKFNEVNLGSDLHQRAGREHMVEGMTLRWEATLTREGDRFVAGCKSASVAAVLSAPEVKGLTYTPDGKAVVTFEAVMGHDNCKENGCLVSGASHLTATIANVSLTGDDIAAWGRKFVVVNVPVKAEPKVTLEVGTLTLSLKGARDLRRFLGEQPYGGEFQPHYDAVREAVRNAEAG